MDRIWDAFWLSAPTGWHWLALAALLAVVEALTPATVALWFAIAALVVGLTLFAAPGLALVFQVLAFALLALAGVLLWFSVFRSRRVERPRDDSGVLNDRLAALVGSRGIVLTADRAGFLRVRIGDTSWPARPLWAEDITPPGAVVEVRDTRDGVLVVEAAHFAPESGVSAAERP